MLPLASSGQLQLSLAKLAIIITVSALLMAGLSAAGPVLIERDCTNVPDGIYPGQKDCTTFYNCTGGHTDLIACPPSLLFDKIDLVCTWPDLARCTSDDCSAHVGGELDGRSGCQGHVKGDLYPDPYDCQFFYQCAEGAAPGQTLTTHHKVCGEGQHFNSQLKACDRAEAGGCKGCQSAVRSIVVVGTTEPPTTTTTLAPTPTTAPPKYPHRGSSSEESSSSSSSSSSSEEYY